MTSLGAVVSVKKALPVVPLRVDVARGGIRHVINGGIPDVEIEVVIKAGRWSFAAR